MDDPFEMHEKIKNTAEARRRTKAPMFNGHVALVNSYLRLARRSDPSMFSFLLANGCSEIKYNPKLFKMTAAGGAVSLRMYKLFCTSSGSLISC